MTRRTLARVLAIIATVTSLVAITLVYLQIAIPHGGIFHEHTHGCPRAAGLIVVTLLLSGGLWLITLWANDTS